MPEGKPTSWERAACFASLPGFEKAKAFGFWPGSRELDCLCDGRVGIGTDPVEVVPFSPWTFWTPGAAYVLARPSWPLLMCRVFKFAHRVQSRLALASIQFLARAPEIFGRQTGDKR